jgi:hypothetical protein
MNWQWNGFAIPQLICVIITISLIFNMQFFRRIRGVREVIILLVLSTIWNLGYFLELISTDPLMIIAISSAKYIGIVFISVVFFRHILISTGFDKGFKIYHQVMIIIVPITILILVFTNRPLAKVMI